jgi:hypothetical protein
VRGLFDGHRRTVGGAVTAKTEAAETPRSDKARHARTRNQADEATARARGVAKSRG